jgi:pyrroline-5-carboxylate reductase
VQVTSPGGATIAALAVMEEKGVRSAFMQAVAAAADKSAAMGAFAQGNSSRN